MYHSRANKEDDGIEDHFTGSENEDAIHEGASPSRRRRRNHQAVAPGSSLPSTKKLKVPGNEGLSLSPSDLQGGISPSDYVSEWNVPTDTNSIVPSSKTALEGSATSPVPADALFSPNAFFLGICPSEADQFFSTDSVSHLYTR
jgi:hypothetical protein